MVAAAGVLGLLVLGVIIIIITRNDRVTIDTEKGNTTVTNDQTLGGSGGLSVNAGEAGDSRVRKPPAPPATSAPGTGAVTAASEPSAAGGSSASAPPATPSAGQRADAAAQPLASGVKPATVATNSIGMRLALLPGGEFEMGSPEDDKEAADNEKPRHKVRISPFYLGIYEVTQAQYRAVSGSNPSRFSSTGGGKDLVAGRSTDQFPVENVSWLDAALFCNALSEKEGFAPFYQDNEQTNTENSRGPGYRLPTEAEWEYACRAGTTTKYSFGNDPWIFGKYAWNDGAIHPVGEKHPNAYGLYDMHANVFEWCSDWYDGGYYKQSPLIDPPGPTSVWRKVCRGGSWNSNYGNCRSAYRDSEGTAYRNPVMGFRVARTQSAIAVSDKPLAPPAGASGAATTTVRASVDQPSVTPVAGLLGEELIKNAGCEETGADSKIPSWETVVGSWSRGSKDFDPFEGKAYFCPGNVTEAELRQDVDVSRFAERIDRKMQSFEFAAHVRSWDQPSPDTTRVVIEFLGNDKSIPLSHIDSGRVVHIGSWRLLESVTLAPAHTRWIRIRLISNRQAGQANDGVYDGLSLKAVGSNETEPQPKNAVRMPLTTPAQAVADQTAAPPPARGSPEEKLNTRGLTRSGAYLVLAAEAEILDKFEKVKPLIASMQQAFDLLSVALNNEMLLADAEGFYNAKRAEVDTANAALGRMPNGNRANSEEKMEYQLAQTLVNGLTQQRDEAFRTIEVLRTQQVPAGQKEELANQLTVKRADFLKATAELTPMVDKAQGEYHKLKADPSVTDALAAFRRSAKTAALLGPSKEFRRAVDTIAEAKRVFSPESAAPKKKVRPTNAPATAAPKKKGPAAKR